ncbi:MAG: hypothetical protein SNJ71_00970 [Bacteroidales bacterium]
MNRKIVLYFFIIFTYISYSQSFMLWNNDTINKIDSRGLKQGTWMFFDNTKQVVLVCSYNNDSIIGNRVFLEDGKPKLIRKKIVNDIEPFIYIDENYKFEGAYNLKNGGIDISDSSIISDTTVMDYISSKFIFGIPALYDFGKTNIYIYLDEIIKPILKNTGNKVSLLIKINSTGIVDDIEIKLKNEDPVLKTKIYNELLKLQRWQPAFSTWKTQPYIFKTSYEY